MKIGLIGLGNMAEAIARGVEEHTFTGWDPSEERRRFFKNVLGAEIAPDNAGVVDRSELVLFAVKPQNRKEIFKELANCDLKSKILLSIMAGVSVDEIAASTGCDPSRIIRCMPNTPMLVHSGVVGVYAARNLRGIVESVFEPIARVFFFEDEIDLDRVTALSGTGPAYVFYFLEALVEAGVKTGLDPVMATEMMFATAEGAMKLLLSEGRDPVELRKKVTSPGGTTEAAISKFQERHFKESVTAAVTAAFERSLELGKFNKE